MFVFWVFFFRIGLHHTDDCRSAEHLLHHCFSLGVVLPVQLLYLGFALGFLQQHLEHRWDALSEISFTLSVTVVTWKPPRKPRILCQSEPPPLYFI